jgi:hypothetical protein
LSSTQWKLIAKIAQIGKTENIDLELLLSLAADQKMERLGQ